MAEPEAQGSTDLHMQAGPGERHARLDEQVAAVDGALEALRQGAHGAAQLLRLGGAHDAAPVHVQLGGVHARALLRARHGWLCMIPAFDQYKCAAGEVQLLLA